MCRVLYAKWWSFLWNHSLLFLVCYYYDNLQELHFSIFIFTTLGKTKRRFSVPYFKFYEKLPIELMIYINYGEKLNRNTSHTCIIRIIHLWRPLQIYCNQGWKMHLLKIFIQHPFKCRFSLLGARFLKYFIFSILLCFKANFFLLFMNAFLQPRKLLITSLLRLQHFANYFPSSFFHLCTFIFGILIYRLSK